VAVLLYPRGDLGKVVPGQAFTRPDRAVPRRYSGEVVKVELGGGGLPLLPSSPPGKALSLDSGLLLQDLKLGGYVRASPVYPADLPREAVSTPAGVQPLQAVEEVSAGGG
jgi:hypothetical protein